MSINQNVFNRQCSYQYQIKANLMSDTLKCIWVHFDTSDYCQKLESVIPANLPRKPIIEDLGTHKMLNIDFRGTHVYKSLFSIQLSLKIAQVEVSQIILKISCI